MINLPEKEKGIFVLAFLVPALTVVAILVLIYNGVNAEFYALAAVAIILGFYVTYSIPRLEDSQRRVRRKK